MSFKIHLFLASLSLATRALRLFAAGTLLSVSAVALALSKRVSVATPLKVEPTHPQPMTVEELLSMADRWHSTSFVLRLPNALIEITQVNETLETAAFNSGSEGHPIPRHQQAFFAAPHRSTSDKTAIPIPPPGFLQS
jgi:hypothetical protein